MWSRRNAFPLTNLRESTYPPIAETPTKNIINEKYLKINFISALAYTLIPITEKSEATQVLSWIFDDINSNNNFNNNINNIIEAFTQVEYFFTGTDTGELFMFPLLPPSMRDFVKIYNNNNNNNNNNNREQVPWNAGPRRLLHRHIQNEPIISIVSFGTLIASISSDAYLHLSIFHPTPQHIITIKHPSPLKSLYIWEGNIFVTRETNIERKSFIAQEESVIAYIFTGDESGIIRMWRANIDNNTYFLANVFVISTPTGIIGFESPIHCLNCEDASCRNIITKQSKIIYNINIDDDKRLLAGVDGGIVVWSLLSLPWKNKEKENILLWNEEKLLMDSILTPKLHFRAERLLNMSVWVKGVSFLQKNLSYNSNEINNEKLDICKTSYYKSKWKPKYGTHVANGFDIGVVSNIVNIPPQYVLSCNNNNSNNNNNTSTVVSFLHNTYVPIIFPSLKNTVYFPLSVVEPVFTPLYILSTTGSTCFNLLILQPSHRIITSGSNGEIILWIYNALSEIYVKTLISDKGQGHNGLVRNICLLRAPDIFISCGYDDGIVKEWHVYDEPELLMRCERYFTLLSANSYNYNNIGERKLIVGEYPQEENNNNNNKMKDENPLQYRKLGISCAVSFPVFNALFLVGVFESIIQSFSLLEVFSCAPPPNYIFNGYKTILVRELSDDDICV